ncbi:MAG: ABC transporter ATP-binding protein [Methanobacteriota archaeon]
MTQNFVIETTGLTKRYDELVAVDSLNLSIKEGELFGLLGPNGAGKTTTVLMLLGLTEPTSGTCRVFGFDPFREPMKVKSISGYLAERMGVYEDLTAEQNLNYILKLNRVPESESRKRVKEALEVVSASSYSNVKVGKLSRGMRQRVGIAGVLVKKPKIAFFDEPTQGLDPEGSRELLSLFKRLGREEKTTILLLSHILHDVQQICDRMGIMMKGKMVVQGSIDELRHKRGEEWSIDIEAKNITQELMQELSGLRGVKNVKRTENLVSVESERDLRLEVMEAFVRNKASPLELKARERSLEEIYVKYLGGA